MKNGNAWLIAVLFLLVLGTARADYSVADKGLWPESWPKEMEPLRKQAQTYVGPQVEYRRYLVPFTKRDEFEAAWPHLLKAKSPGAPIFLVKGPRTDFFAIKPAGVLIQAPPENVEKGAEFGKPDARKSDVRTQWRNAVFIELVVDGEIVDLNRIELPGDCPIVDERFKEAKK
jgi:hypothetical protein